MLSNGICQEIEKYTLSTTSNSRSALLNTEHVFLQISSQGRIWCHVLRRLAALMFSDVDSLLPKRWRSHYADSGWLDARTAVIGAVQSATLRVGVYDVISYSADGCDLVSDIIDEMGFRTVLDAVGCY